MGRETMSPDQQKAAKYFSGGGCLGGGMKDDQYDAMMASMRDGLRIREKALSKIGLDASEVAEIAPVTFEGWSHEKYETHKVPSANGGMVELPYLKCGLDNKWRTSQYEVTWLFFSATQVYMYRIKFSLVSDNKKETCEEYFYKDITNFSHITETEERLVSGKGGCMKKAGQEKRNVEISKFQLSAMGDKFYCSTQQDIEGSIQAMKQKLREKKGA